MIAVLNEYMDGILKFANILVLAFAAFRFTRQPTKTLEERVTALEKKTEEIEKKLTQGNDKFGRIGKALEIFARCTLALIDWEIHYCETEHKVISPELAEEKKELHKFLSDFDMMD
jgi:hypothetical protein